MDLPALQQAVQRRVAGLAGTDDLPSSLPESFKSKGLESTDIASIIATLKDQNRDNDSSIVSCIKPQIHNVFSLTHKDPHQPPHPRSPPP
jgi:hypothetical protein